MKVSKDILESFKQVAPYLSVLLKRELVVFITDREEITYVYSTNANIIKQGEKIVRGGAANRCMSQQHTVEAMVNKEDAGVDLRSVFIPVADNQDQIVGSIGVSVERSKETSLLEISQALSEMAREVQASTQEMHGSSEILHQEFSITCALVDNMIEGVRTVYHIGNVVRNIASETRTLGLNATIDSVKAGEAGRSLAAAAKEVRTLAEKSEEMVKEMQAKLDQNTQFAFKVRNGMDKANECVEHLNQVIQEIAEACMHLESTSWKIFSMAREI